MEKIVRRPSAGHQTLVFATPLGSLLLHCRLYAGTRSSRPTTPLTRREEASCTDVPSRSGGPSSALQHAPIVVLTHPAGSRFERGALVPKFLQLMTQDDSAGGTWMQPSVVHLGSDIGLWAEECPPQVQRIAERLSRGYRQQPRARCRLRIQAVRLQIRGGTACNIGYRTVRDAVS